MRTKRIRSRPVRIVISQEESNQIMLQDSLEAILSTLDGAGKVRVLLTQSQGEKIIYKTDIRMREDETEESTIIISGTGKEQRGLISQVIPPQYKGAVILCQGADNATIRLAIVNTFIEFWLFLIYFSANYSLSLMIFRLTF